jgi:hypothetical protein
MKPQFFGTGKFQKETQIHIDWPTTKLLQLILAVNLAKSMPYLSANE